MGSAYIQESLPNGNPVGDDDKIYFFFSEAGKEFEFFDNTIVSRIARVCKVSDASTEMAYLKCLSPLSKALSNATHFHSIYWKLSEREKGVSVHVCVHTSVWCVHVCV